MSQTGRCLCGAVSYTIDADPVVVALCHCDDCQRQSGAAFSTNLVVPRAALKVEGSPKTFHTTGTDSHGDRERQFCGECGSVMFTLLADQPDIAVVKAGSLDDRSGVQPALELWQTSAQPWVAAGGERQGFERGLPG